MAELRFKYNEIFKLKMKFKIHRNDFKISKEAHITKIVDKETRQVVGGEQKIIEYLWRGILYYLWRQE